MQTISLIAALSRIAGCVKPHIVVVPLSTIRNWEREFATWAPFLNVVVMTGNAKARKTLIDHELYMPLKRGARRVASLQVCASSTNMRTSLSSGVCMGGCMHEGPHQAPRGVEIIRVFK